MSAVLMRFKDASLGYGTKSVVARLNFSIQKNDFIGIIGPNGSGKTTILKAILGLIQPVHGAIDRRTGLIYGYVPQSSVLDDLFPFTVYDVVKMGMFGNISVLHRFTTEDNDRIRSILRSTGVDRYADTPYRDLSGGLKQRALIARALVNRPDVLVLDEPTNDLDIAGERAVMDLIQKLHDENNITVIMVSHLVNVVINYVKKIGFIDTDTFDIHPIDAALNDKGLWKAYHAMVTLGTVGGRKVIVAG